MKRKSLLTILISLFILLNWINVGAMDRSVMVGSRAGDTPPAGQFVPGEVIVKMKPQASLIPQDLSILGVEAVGPKTSGGEIIYKIKPDTLRGLSAKAAKDETLKVVESFKARPDVEYAQPNYILYPFKTPNDPLFSRQWDLHNFGTGAGESPGGISMPKAWDKSIGSHDVVVAVIDTGILPDHPDISGSANLVQGYDMISDTKRANDGDGRDNDPTDAGDAIKQGECSVFPPSPPRDYPNSWHGTHVAGTVGVGKTDNGQGIAGINWKVKLQAVRVLGKCGASTSDINDGIRWAAGLSVPGAPANPTPAKVINMSLGGGQPCSQSPSMQQAINDAVNAGTAVVVAAGNSGKDAAGFVPAGCNNVITVAASGPDGKLVLEKVNINGQTIDYYSNWGDTIEIMAPGGKTMPGCTQPEDGILSTLNQESHNCMVDNVYAYYSGTSMAAPHVAGVAALWLSQDPTLSPAQLSSELQRHAQPRDSSQCPKPCGAGLLSALREGGGGTPTPPPPTQLKVDLVLDPQKDIYEVGEQVKVLAKVTLDGVPQQGKTVNFSSESTDVASVSPASSVTDAKGESVTTLQMQNLGDTNVYAKANGAEASKPVKVPDLSWFGIALLTLAVIGIVWRKKAPTSA